jgi:hypothetical protein
VTAAPDHAREVRDFTSRDRWIRGAAADPTLSPIARLVAVRLGLFLNCKTGRCDPSYGTLGREISISERSAIRAVAALEARGWIEVDRNAGGRRDNTNQFRLLTPAGRVTPVSPQGVTAESPLDVSGVTTATRRGDRRRQQGVTELCHPNNEEKNEEKNERDRLSPASDLFKDDASVETPPAAKKNLKPSAAANDAAFEEFYLIYPRRVAKPKARRAFAAATKRASVSTIIDAARRFAIARKDQDEKFTPYPATWLNDNRWNDEPALNGATVTIDGETGEVIAKSPRDHSSGSSHGRGGWPQVDETMDDELARMTTPGGNHGRH